MTESLPISPPQIHIAVFEGPLDLLLHLCREAEVDVTAIPVAIITAQYLEYLDLMKRLNLEIAGEFLSMAATLCYIKSRELLPRSPEPDEEEEAGDPRKELILRLLQYRKYKEAADSLARRPILDRDLFQRPATAEAQENAGPAPIEAGLFELLAALREMLTQKARQPALHRVHLEPVTLGGCMRTLLRGLKSGGGSATFRTLFGAATGKREILVTFLALLEMIRLRILRVYQADPWGDLSLSLHWLGEEEDLPFPETGLGRPSP